MKTFIVEVTDDSKVEFVETLLNQLDFVSVKKDKKETKPLKKKIKKAKKSAVELFSHTIGMWEGRDIDARELRKKAWSGTK